MTWYKNLIEIYNLADVDAVEASLLSSFESCGLTDLGSISGETRSHYFHSTCLNNEFTDKSPGDESFYFEFHYVSGEEWKASCFIDIFGGVPLYRSQQVSFYPRTGSLIEKTVIVSDGINDLINPIQEPSWIQIITHNTNVNIGVGEFNFVHCGMTIRMNKPFTTRINAQANTGATSLILSEELYRSLDPDRNDDYSQTVYLTDIESENEEEVTITSTPTDLLNPTIEALSGTFPANSIISSVKYSDQLFCLTMESTQGSNTIELQSDYLNLQQSLNGNFESTYSVVKKSGVIVGTIPNIRAIGDNVLFNQGDVVHREREKGLFENARDIKHPYDDDLNYTVVKP